MAYNYLQRRIETTRGKIAAKGTDTLKSAKNIRAQYRRPLHIHSGPNPMLQQDGNPFEWPWVHLYTSDVERNQDLELISIWPLYPKFRVHVYMDLLSVSLATNQSPDPIESFNDITNFRIDASVLSRTNGTTTLTPIANFQEQVKNFKSYLADPRRVAGYPVLNMLANAINLPGFNINGHLQDSGLRAFILKENDMGLVRSVDFTFEVDTTSLGSFSTIRNNPLVLKLSNTVATQIAWHSSYNKNAINENLKDFKYVRVYNIASFVTMEGIE